MAKTQDLLTQLALQLGKALVKCAFTKYSGSGEGWEREKDVLRIHNNSGNPDYLYENQKKIEEIAESLGFFRKSDDSHDEIMDLISKG